ncbi:hypothetical protein GALMADRAFT_240168 [Galerina marginata CBS 339.88]|uniref:Uncharacterized protein n=1 Tax=Galerina marginata (strain CBS 339.88) TaxID=685588 RepID=A0A067TFA4_GALM3|nr:hypothetical protein GALMADRAFT_240168 [Galerina marginata CBS 339.88]
MRRATRPLCLVAALQLLDEGNRWIPSRWSRASFGFHAAGISNRSLEEELCDLLYQNLKHSLALLCEKNPQTALPLKI